MRIQDLIADNTEVIIPTGEYQLPEPIQLENETTVIFDEGVSLHAEYQGPVIQVNQCTGVYLVGGNTLIDGGIEDESASYEHYHGIEIRESYGIHVSGFTISNVGGDGVYIGPTDAASEGSENICIEGCDMTNPLRNGVSITSGKDVMLNGINTMGRGSTYGNKGILLEQSDMGDWMEDIMVYQCYAESPRSHGIHVQMNRGGPISAYICHSGYSGNGYATRSTCPPERKDMVTGYLKYVDCDGRHWDEWEAQAELVRI